MTIEKPIDINSNIIRFAKKRHIDENTGNFSIAAFLLREDEQYLSFDWLEFHKCYNHNIQKSIDAILNRFLNNSTQKVKYNNRKYFASIDIKTLFNNTRDKKFNEVKIKLINNNDSHAGIFYNTNLNDELAFILVQIANKNRI